MNHVAPMLLLLAGLLGSAACADEPPASCSSDHEPEPTALLERFVNADCADCWRLADPAPVPGSTLVLDWIALGSGGEDGALAAAARPDAAERLQALGQPLPARVLRSESRVAEPSTHSAGAAPPLRLRVAHGRTVGNYIGASIELRGATPGRWRLWLLLVERLPAGLAGSPIARQLVRNSAQFDWTAKPAPEAGSTRFWELRPMQIPDGAQYDRLAVAGFVEQLDAQPARIVAAAQSHCGGEP